jgi:hypothetical protein
MRLAALFHFRAPRARRECGPASQGKVMFP